MADQGNRAIEDNYWQSLRDETYIGKKRDRKGEEEEDEKKTRVRNES
jgi:hypothetical protein